MLSPEEIRTLIAALGCGIGAEDFDRQAALPPRHHHDRRGRGRLAHPHAAADVLLPADAAADRTRAHLHRAAAAVPRQARQAGTYIKDERRSRASWCIAPSSRGHWCAPPMAATSGAELEKLLTA